MDIVAWAEANLKRPAGAEPEPWSPSTIQRAIIEAMQEPGVRMRVLRPGDLRRSDGPSLGELLLFLEATRAGGDVLIYERTEGDDE
ncbi:hypothetical protein OKC48_07395 [Methylorubrum extorquens]|uniref:hypothetical protein n=1 Tax=Methylorubrum extorquens TaxID=408 RepID=UPI002237CB96|nr:hypothetical protein [Methylorubrum extorquens]UYW28330.1 hypothetical protein OKC48_07395 [Methylorubrum extorquens]